MGWGSLAGAGLGAAAGGVFGGPMGAGVGMGLGGALGGALEGVFGDDPSVAPANVDPALYGTPGYDDYLASVGQRQAGYDGRTAPELDWAQANQDRALALQARDYQDRAAQSYQDVLSGKAPSLAQQQLQQGLTTANAQAAQQAASVRGGPGNLLLAGQQAQRTAAANSLATNAAAGQLRAREIDAARAGLLGAGSQMRGQDLEQRGQSQAQQKIGADVQLQQTGLNDAMSRALEQGRLAALQGQQGGREQYAHDVLAAQQGVQGINAGIAAQNAQRDRDMTAGMLQTGGQLASMGFQADQNQANRDAYSAAHPAPAPMPLGGVPAPTPAATPGGGGGSWGGGSDVVDPWGVGVKPYVPGSGSGGSSSGGSGYSQGGGYGKTDPGSYGDGKYRGYAPWKDEP